MKFTYRTLAVAVAAALMVPTQATFAQDENLTEEVVVIGTRTEGRSARRLTRSGRCDRR